MDSEAGAVDTSAHQLSDRTAMEFFATARVSTAAPALQAAVTVHALPALCASIERLLENRGDDQALIWCVWGEFQVNRERIAGGVRFTLPDCANGLAWTITTGFAPTPEAVVVHATINRPAQDVEFVETLEQFVTDWKRGLEAALPA